jgi:pyrroline-5-carboxylate reductase
MNLLRTSQTAAVQTPVMKREVSDLRYQQQQLLSSSNTAAPSGIKLRTKVSNSVLDDSSMILSSQFLGNVAANYKPPPPPAFVPVIVQKVKKRRVNKKDQSQQDEDGQQAAAGGANQHQQDEKDDAAALQVQDSGVVLVQPSIELPAVTTCCLPPLDIAAPARNLCLELISTRIVALVRCVSLLLQEFSSSPGQSLPHVALIGSGNVGHTILSHLVKMLPPDRIVVLARDEKSDVCTTFATQYGVRSLSTNILRNDVLVDVVRSHRAAEGSKAAVSSSSSAAANSASAAAAGGAGSGTASHVSPEVAAAHSLSETLQNVHVLIVACRPAQLSETASSLQPWLRSSACTVVSTLAGVTADRVAQLFRVPSSISCQVDTNDMLFAFESSSLLSTKHGAATAAAAAAAAQQQQLLIDTGFLASSTRSRAGVVAASAAAAADGQQLLAAIQQRSVVTGNSAPPPFRFFTHEAPEFVHRLFFALVTTLLERCGISPPTAWCGAAKLLLGRAMLTPPAGIGAQGPSLVSRCSAKHLAAASGLSVGEVLQTIDTRLARFAGIQ